MKFTRTPHSRKGGFTLIELLVVIAILAALGTVGYPAILDHMNDGDRQVAKSNLGQLSTMLLQFNNDYGKYPCDDTAEDVQSKRSKLDFGELTGNTSNPYFRQLLLNANTSSEKIFYAKVQGVPAEGDNKVAHGEALKKGENAMGYVMRNGRDEGTKTSVNKNLSTTPIAICSVYPSNTPYPAAKAAYDINSFRGHVFVLSCDGSIKDYEDLIEDEVEDGMGTMDPEKDIFPETTSGKKTVDRHVILSPEL